MDENYKYIDNLVKGKLQSYQAKGALLGWSKLNKALSFKRFLKFSLAKFNIYYAAVIISGASIGTYMAVNHSNKNEIQQATIIELNQRNHNILISRDTIIKLDTLQNINSQDIKKTQEIKIPKEDTVKIEYLKDSIIIEKRKNTTIPKKQVKVIKKQVFIRDTVLKKDTIVVKKVIQQQGEQK